MISLANILLRTPGTNLLYAEDDGTDIIVKAGSIILFKIRKSDNQLLLDAGVDTDAF